MKKIIAAFLTLALLLSLSACGFDPLFFLKKGIGDLPADEAMARVSENMKEIQSLKMDGSMEMEMSAMGITVSFKSDYKAEHIVSPNQTHMLMTMDMGDFGGKQEAESYTLVDDDKYAVYTKVEDEWTKTWSESPVSALEEASMYADSVTSYEIIGKEKINGEDTIHFSGIIAQDKIAEIFEKSEFLSNFSNLGIDFSSLTESDGLGNIVFDVWASEKEGLIVRMSLDMTEFMSNLFAASGVGDQIDIEKVNIVCDYSGYNTVTEITLPKEARQAK